MPQPQPGKEPFIGPKREWEGSAKTKVTFQNKRSQYAQAPTTPQLRCQGFVVKTSKQNIKMHNMDTVGNMRYPTTLLIANGYPSMLDRGSNYQRSSEEHLQKLI